MNQPIPSETIEYEQYVDGLRRSNADMHAALKDLLGDRPSVQGGICQHCGRDYIGDILEGDCPSDDCPSFLAREIIHRAEPATVSPTKTITIHIEGGLVQDVTGIPTGFELRIEDYDVQDPGDDSWDAKKECVVTVYAGGTT